ncbi:MAG: hypothetical protein HS132_08035 [Planctomycetia bacterium]|nr:hypothetical protein [Planctomycetia bacterium]
MENFISNLNPDPASAINKANHFFYCLHGGPAEEKLRGEKVLTPLANAVCDDKSELFNDRFGWLLKLCKQETTIDKVPWSWVTTTNKVLRSFLPLDIDMQALADKTVDVNKEKYLQEMAKDLEELYSSIEKKNIHYRRKIYDLWYLLRKKEWLKEKNLEYSPELEKFTPIGKPTSKLYELAGIKDEKPDLAFQIHNFLMMLDTNTDILENKAKEICKPLHITVPDKENNTTEEINTFHEGYCKLYEYLKKHEV